MFKKIPFLTGLFSPKLRKSEFDFSEIEKILDYSFKNKSLLRQSLKHSSYLSITKESYLHSNERLEFLGDAVLELAVTDYLYGHFPDYNEGKLSKVKSVLVSRKVLAEIVIRKELGKFLFLDHGEEKTGGKTRISNMANLYEALIGAIYLDSGLAQTVRFIDRTLLSRYRTILNDENFINYKSILLEYIQGRKEGVPVYHLVESIGPDHDKHFIMQVSIPGGPSAQGEGKSKKIAEQKSAKSLLSKIAPELI